MLKRRNICHSQEQDQTYALTITGRRGHSLNPIKRKSQKTDYKKHGRYTEIFEDRENPDERLYIVNTSDKRFSIPPPSSRSESLLQYITSTSRNLKATLN